MLANLCFYFLCDAFRKKLLRSNEIEDFIYATLGHNLENNEVIQHKYFGTNKVINDLNNVIRNKNGKIYLTKEMYKRNKNNEVSYIGYKFNCNLTDIMKTFFYANL